MSTITKFVLTLIALAMPLFAQQPTPVPENAAPASTTAADQDTLQKRHDAAMRFLEASDARQRFEQTLDKLLDDGKKDLLKRNQGLDPRFADEWEKRMRLRVKADEFVNGTAQVYAKYFTRNELDELAQAQLAMKKGQVRTISGELDKKLKSDSALIQRDINLQTTLIGARLGKEVGLEVEHDHPEWGKNTAPANPEPPKK